MPLFDERLIDKIMHAWRVMDFKQHYKDFPVGVPDRDEIESIVKTSFFSSIQQEESRFIRFTLSYLITDKATQPRHRLSQFNVALRFEKAEELTVESLRKLAGSIDDRTSTLLVEKRNGAFWIVGIAPFGRRTSLLSAATYGYPRPEAFCVTARSPGSLIFSRAGSILGRFTNGEFEISSASPFHSEALGKDLIARIETHDLFERFKNHYWGWYSAALEHLLRSAAGRGHGASIVYLPLSTIPLALSQTALARNIDGFHEVGKLLREAINCDSESQLSMKLWADSKELQIKHNALSTNYGSSSRLVDLKGKLLTLLNTIAQLSAVDGALLIDEHFCPRAFGARLQGNEWKGNVRLGPRRGFTSFAQIERGRFGTRHNSAIDFAAAVPGCIVFVVSQDGPVRAITRREDCVFLWPDCFSTVFFE